SKVWNDLLARFTVAGDGSWRPPAGEGKERLPALGMSPGEARKFTARVGGRLPTVRQWDKAAGYYRQEGRAGPARGPAVAVNRRAQGPRPIDEAGDDVSPYGIQDMA